MRLLLLLVLMAQDGVQPRTAQVDQLNVSIQSAIDVDILVRDGEGESTKLLSIVRRERFAQEAAGADGFRVRCVMSTIQKSGTGVPLKEEPTDLNGKTFLVTRAGSVWKVSASDGHGLPTGAGGLGAWNDIARLLPKDAVQQGSSWRVASKDLAALILLDPVTEASGSLDVSCDAVMDGKVTLSFKGSIDCRGSDDSNIRVTIGSGSAVIDSSKGRPIKLSVSGALEATKDVVEISKKPGQLEDEKRKVGEIVTRSKKLEATFTFE